MCGKAPQSQVYRFQPERSEAIYGLCSWHEYAEILRFAQDDSAGAQLAKN
jgi:hypothetical protein